MLNGNDPGLGREALVARCNKGGKVRNSLAPPQGSIIIIDELGRPIKQSAVTVTINEHPPAKLTSDEYGRIYPLVAEADEVKIDFEDAHESGEGDSIATESGNHFERGGDAPRTT